MIVKTFIFSEKGKVEKIKAYKMQYGPILKPSNHSPQSFGPRNFQVQCIQLDL